MKPRMKEVWDEKYASLKVREGVVSGRGTEPREDGVGKEEVGRRGAGGRRIDNSLSQSITAPD